VAPDSNVRGRSSTLWVTARRQSVLRGVGGEPHLLDPPEVGRLEWR